MINKLGFGFLRLPKKEREIDWDAVTAMVDVFLAGGRTFFDTCYTYLNGLSEAAIKRCVSSRIPRDRFMLCDKLPGYLFKSHADCQKYFEEELERCGVEWFDVLMLHWLNDVNYEKAEKYEEFRFLREKKAEGSAKRIGFSFHGSAELLDRILREHPEVDVVLLQLNYADWNSVGIQSRRCYETCVRHGKAVFAMEPVKGGTLSSLPEEAEAMLRKVHPDWTPSDWALRFVQSLPAVEICLSGMAEVSQVEDNIRPFEPLNEEEIKLLMEVRKIIEKATAVPCTSCRYCESHCPKKIPIPQYLGMLNELHRFPREGWKIAPTYHQLAQTSGKASDCISCHSCEKHCPQRIDIAARMKEVTAAFEE